MGELLNFGGVSGRRQVVMVVSREYTRRCFFFLTWREKINDELLQDQSFVGG